MRSFIQFICGGFLTLSVLAGSPNRASAFELSALGGVNFAAPTQRTNGAEIRQTGNATPTFGLFASTPLFGSAFEIEIGVVSLAQQSERDTVTPFVTQKMQFIQVPLLLRFKLDETIGLGAGFYTAFAQGNIQNTQNNVTTETTYESQLLNKTDSGLLLNIHIRFAMAPPFYFVLDGRYQHGLTNMAQTQNDLLNTRSIQGLAGFSYQFPTGGSHRSSDRGNSERRVLIIDEEDE